MLRERAGRLLSVVSITVLLSMSACSDDDSGNTNDNNNNNVVGPAVCGNGQVEAGEQCDDGADNSDTAPDACRANCRLPFCGDGVVDTSEGCDEGSQNSDYAPNACRASCQWFSCGDGVVDTDASPLEECDDGADNSDTAPDACRTSCRYASCGDGVPDKGQICYQYFGIAQPSGLLSPFDVDGDGRDELVGQIQGVHNAVQVVASDGNSLDRGRAFIIPRSFQPTQAAGELSGPGQGTVVVPGAGRAVLALGDGNRDLRLPRGFRVPRGENQTSDTQAPAVGINTASGNRYVVFFDYRNLQVCTVPLDSLGRFDEAGLWCAAATLPPFDPSGVVVQQTLQALPTNGPSPAIAVYSLHGDRVDVYELDAQARLSDHRWHTTPDHKAGVIVAQASRTNPTAWHLAVIDYVEHYDSFTGATLDAFGSVEYRAWDPAAVDFASSGTTVVATDTFFIPFARDSAAAIGDLGGTGSWLDLVLLPRAAQGAIYRNGGSGYIEGACAFAGDPTAVAIVDLDGLGDPELVIGLADWSSGLGPGIAIYPNLGTADCLLPNATFHSLEFAPTRMAAADLDGDGRHEVLAGTTQHPDNWPLYTVAVLDGTATAPTPLPIGVDAEYLTPFPRATPSEGADLLFSVTDENGEGWSLIGLVEREAGGWVTGLPVRTGGTDFTGIVSQRMVVDVTGDGQDDLVLLDALSARIHVFTGPYTAPDGFVAQATYDLPFVPGTFAIGDLDDDGLPELVLIRSNPVDTAEEPDELVTILRNNNGAFDTAPVVVTAAHEPTVVAVADFDGDGYGDLATVHGNAGLVRVMLNDGSGDVTAATFANGTNYISPGQAWTVSPIDLDGDGALDLVASTPRHGNGPIWLQGRGDGTFEEAVDLGITASEFAVIPARITDDAFQDLVVVTIPSMEDGMVFETVVLRGTP